MNVTTERKDDVVSILTSGRVDGVNASQFGEAARAAIKDDDRAVIVDFENVTYVSSTGLRVLLMLIRDLLRREIKVSLCAMSDQVRNVVRIGGFDKLIPIHPSRAAALASLGVQAAGESRHGESPIE